MSFKDKQFKDRFSDTMWNHSERVFEDVWAHPWERFGLGESDDQSKIDTWHLTSFIRHRPDYITQVGRTLYLMEVQGTSTSQKFKQSKLDACSRWNKEHQVFYWCWDDKNKEEAVISHNKVQLLIAQGLAEKGLFDGKRPYWALPIDVIKEQADWGHNVR